MLIKDADDRSQDIAELRRRAEGATGQEAQRLREQLARRSAGQRGEDESAYLINFDFAQSPNWAVLHDLRLEHNGRTAQIDHLLVSRWLEFYVLETKHFHAGIKITEEGEFLRWNQYQKTYEGMASPLQQNERHVAVLSDVVSTIELPSRLGMRIAPSYHPLVLVAPHARISRPQRFDTSRVVKADQLKPRIWKDVDNDHPVALLLKVAAKLVSSDTLKYVAQQLAARHAPVVRSSSGAAAPSARHASAASPAPAAAAPVAKAATTRPAIKTTNMAPAGTPPATIAPPRTAAVAAQPPAPATPAVAPKVSATPTTPATMRQGPACKQCSAAQGRILYGQYGYYFKCAACSGNTALRPTCLPGHTPRLRKQGEAFFRDCKDCGTSTLFHTNPRSDDA